MPAISFTLSGKTLSCELARKVITEYAYTEQPARALLDACLAENVKKGWEKAKGKL
jgi:hypothetical protein